jgi:hypothetical protein
MLRFFANIAMVALMAASGFAGHALAAGHTISALPDSSGFGSNVTETVPVQPIERWLGGGPMKQVPCPVTGTLTVCYLSR